MEKIKVIDATWFTNSTGCIGVVLYDDGFGKIKSKIAIVPGEDPRLDIEKVIDRGSSFPITAMYELLKNKHDRLTQLNMVLGDIV